jgi:hypothetical protein
VLAVTDPPLDLAITCNFQLILERNSPNLAGLFYQLVRRFTALSVPVTGAPRIAGCTGIVIEFSMRKLDTAGRWAKGKLYRYAIISRC